MQLAKFLRMQQLLEGLLLKQESYWKQKNHNDKLVLGDRNTPYFQAKFNSKWRRNKILGF